MSFALAAAALLLASTPKPANHAKPEPAPAFAQKPAVAVAVEGGCRVSTTSCVDFAGAFGGAHEARCKQLKGTWSTEPCPEAGLVATCTQREVGSQDRTLTRSYAPTTAKAARAECQKKARGVFLAK